MKLQPHETKRRLLGLLAMGAGILLLGGCLIIPTNYHTPGSRHNITGQTTNLFQIGITTREEILLALGEPDFASVDGQRLGYRWSKVEALLIVTSYGSGSGAEFVHSYLIEASFDPSNRVSRVRFHKHWGESVTPVHDTEGSR